VRPGSGLSHSTTPRIDSDDVVLTHPPIEVRLQSHDRMATLFAQGDLMERRQDRPIESFANTVGLWAAHFGSLVIDVPRRQVEFIKDGSGGCRNTRCLSRSVSGSRRS
jgi:hypothetical protein